MLELCSIGCEQICDEGDSSSAGSHMLIIDRHVRLGPAVIDEGPALAAEQQTVGEALACTSNLPATLEGCSPSLMGAPTSGEDGGKR